jgi:hypothetical protein
MGVVRRKREIISRSHVSHCTVRPRRLSVRCSRLPISIDGSAFEMASTDLPSFAGQAGPLFNQLGAAAAEMATARKLLPISISTLLRGSSQA